MTLFFTTLLWFFALAMVVVAIWFMLTSARTKRRTQKFADLTARVEASNLAAMTPDGREAWADVYQDWASGQITDDEYVRQSNHILNVEGL